MDFTGWQVLIVDDDLDSLSILEQAFEIYDIPVQMARNGRECLTVLANFVPTLIVMDLEMPEMNGWQTLSHIVADRELDQIPVVALTAYYSAAVHADAVRSGFMACLPKPIHLDSFVDRLIRVVNRE